MNASVIAALVSAVAAVLAAVPPVITLFRARRGTLTVRTCQSGRVTSYPLVITPDDIAQHLGIALPLDPDSEFTISEASLAAQSDLEAYLGRPVVPVTYTDYHRVSSPWGWRLREYPVISITSATPETDAYGIATDLFTVVYVAGLDGGNDPSLEPIRRFIRLHAMYDPAVQIVFRAKRPDIATRVLSGSVQGQAATITDAYPTPGAASMRTPAAITAQMSMPGAPPTLQTCDRWRVGKRRVHQRPVRLGEAAPWPYDLPTEGMGDWWAGRWETWW